MKKPPSSIVHLQTLGVAIAVAVLIATCSTIVSLSVISYQSSPPLSAEFQRLSAQLDVIRERRRDSETRFESLDIRLAEVNEMVNALAGTMINNMAGGRGDVTDMKLMAEREEPHLGHDDAVPLDSGSTD